MWIPGHLLCYITVKILLLGVIGVNGLERTEKNDRHWNGVVFLQMHTHI